MSGSAADDSKLTFVGGPLDGQEYPLEPGEDTLLGADSDCSITLPLENIAAQHARLTWSPGGLVLVDLGGPSGTYVNGEKILGERTLESGDRVCLGPPGSSQSAKILVQVAAQAPADEIGMEDTSPEPAAAAPPPVVPAPMAPPPDMLSFDEEANSVALVPVPEDDSLSPAPPMPAAQAPSVAPPEPEPDVIELEADVAPPEPPPTAAPPVVSLVPPPEEVAPPAPPTVKPAAPTPDYQTAPPSIAPERPRSPVRLPPAAPARPAPAPRRKAKPRRRRGIPRIAIIGGVILLVGLGGLYGLSLMTRPGPSLTRVPPKAEPGQVIKLSGEELEPDASGNVVRFGETPGTVLTATEREISVKVPALEAPLVPVVVEARGKRSNAIMLKIAAVPRIREIKPAVARPEQEIVLEGVNLAADKLAVLVNDVPADVLEKNPQALKVRVPKMAFAEGTDVQVVVRAGEERSQPATLTLGRLPLLRTMEPKKGLPGVRVTLSGLGFSAVPDENIVSFGGQRAVVVKAQPTEVVALAPATPLSHSAVSVTVRVGVSESQSIGFEPEWTSRAIYAPRFFPAMVTDHAGHAHLFVSSEVAPVLLLSDKGAAGSTAERAERVANQLNGLVERGLGGQAIQFEYREGSAAVGCQADPSFLLAATAQDAAGYSEAWSDAAQARGVSPTSVARHWAALLQDYFSLFVEHQRPTALAPLTDRAKVLLDLYAEASRRAGPGAGIPTGLVYPGSTTVTKGLREMALVLGGGPTSARASAVIEGLWNGKMRDGDLTRPVQIRIETSGARLSGSATLRQGGLSVRASLNDVVFERGMLRFALNVGTGTRYFRGQLSGDQLAGTIHDQPSGGRAVGEFALRFTN